MKTVYLVFLIFIGTGTAQALTLNQALGQKVSVAVEQHAQQRTVKPNAQPPKAVDSRQAKIREALKSIMVKNQFSRAEKISFATFLSRSQQADRFLEQASALRTKREGFFYKAFYFKGQPEMLFQGSVPYQKQLTGKKYIFVSEASAHDTISLVKEMTAILAQVRKANPQAHILLASEFSLVSDMQAWPIRFAGKTNRNMFTYDTYSSVDEAANRLGMDVLALDDAISAQDEQGVWYAKIGSTWVRYDSQSPQVRQIAQDFDLDPAQLGEDYAVTLFATFQYFIASSTQGIVLRNRQWFEYIHALAPFYDVIVVYGGNGHLSIEADRDSVALLLNPQQAVSLSLYTSEELSPAAQAAYDKRAQAQAHFQADTQDLVSQASAQVDSLPNEGEEEDLSGELDGSFDFSKPYYRLYQPALMQAWRQKHIRNRVAYEHFMGTYRDFESLIGRGPLHFVNWTDIEVHVPGT